MISRSQSITFESLWIDAYGLNFGTFVDSNNSADYTMDYIVFIGATIINVVLMLNLLISILGNSFERFQTTQVIIDFRERTNLIIEILSIKKLKNFESFKYLHVCISANENEENESWEGRIKYLDTKIDKNFKNLADEIVQDKSLIKDKISSLETKVSFVETKISSVETKINSMNETLEAILKLVQK